ncbi:MAG TPA: hypothetical protein VNJ09_00380 [Chthonomonadales bacterium]|nr:hypothetical protein [Chthonomonadales bacterium]
MALVHGPRREKDVYGQTLPRLLNEQGVTTLRIDIHGRRAVRFDVEAAINFLAYDRAWTATAM